MLEARLEGSQRRIHLAVAVQIPAEAVGRLAAACYGSEFNQLADRDRTRRTEHLDRGLVAPVRTIDELRTRPRGIQPVGQTGRGRTAALPALGQLPEGVEALLGAGTGEGEPAGKLAHYPPPLVEQAAAGGTTFGDPDVPFEHLPPAIDRQVHITHGEWLIPAEHRVEFQADAFFIALRMMDDGRAGRRQIAPVPARVVRIDRLRRQSIQFEQRKVGPRAVPRNQRRTGDRVADRQGHRRAACPAATAGTALVVEIEHQGRCFLWRDPAMVGGQEIGLVQGAGLVEQLAGAKAARTADPENLVERVPCQGSCSADA